MKKTKQIILIVILNLFFSSFAFSQITLHEIYDKHVEATGIKNGIADFSSVAITGKFKQGSREMPLKIKIKFPNMLRIDMVYFDEEFSKATDGEYDWEYYGKRDTVIVAKSRSNPVAEIYNKWTGGFVGFVENGMNAEYIGDTIIDKIKVYRILLTKEKEKTILCVDKTTNLISRIIEDKKNNNYTELSEYKKIDRFKLAHKITSYVQSKHSATMIFDKIEINTEISDEIFHKPE